MAHPSSHGEHAAHGAAKLNHEVTDIPLTGTTPAAIVTVMVLAVIMAGVYGAWSFFEWQAARRDPGAPPMAEKDYGRRLAPLPRVQSMPATDLGRYRATQDAKLGSYGWVNRAAGTVHVPIERAIALIAERASTIADPQAATAPAGSGPGAAAPAPVAPPSAAPVAAPATVPAPPPAASGHAPSGLDPGPAGSSR